MNRQRTLGTLSSVLTGLAYISCLFEWLWVSIVVLPPLIKSGALDWIIKIFAQHAQAEAPKIELNPFILALVGIITLFILVITAVVLIRLPKTIATTGQHTVDQVAELVMPAITHHKKLPAKKQRALSRRIRLIIQLSLAVLPLAVSFFVPPFDQISQLIIITIASWLAGISLLGFVIGWLVQPPVKSTSRTQSHASHE